MSKIQNTHCRCVLEQVNGYLLAVEQDPLTASTPDTSVLISKFCFDIDRIHAKLQKKKFHIIMKGYFERPLCIEAMFLRQWRN